MSSFWFILKQQWTINISSPPFFSIFSLAATLVESRDHRTQFWKGPSKDHSTKVWFKLAQWLQRSWLKYEKLTNGRTDDRRRSLSGDNSSHDPWVRWAKKYMLMYNIVVLILKKIENIIKLRLKQRVQLKIFLI